MRPLLPLSLAIALLAGACASASVGTVVLKSDGRGAATIDTRSLTIGMPGKTDIPPPP